MISMAHGKLDVVQVYHRSSGRVQMWLGNGDGTFQESHPVGGFGLGLEIAAIDLNGDHLSDLVVAGTGGVNVLFGKPDGTFRTIKLPLGNQKSLVQCGLHAFCSPISTAMVFSISPSELRSI